MLYQSTRGGASPVSSARAIVDGLAPDGGLYVMAPGEIPQVDWRSFLALDYPSLAAKILSALLPDFDEAEAKALVTAAYTGKFSDARIAPLHAAGDDPRRHLKAFAMCPASASWSSIPATGSAPCRRRRWSPRRAKT